MSIDREELISSRFDQARARSYIALDVPSFDDAAELVLGLGPAVTGYKVGLELFHAAGYRIVEWLIEQEKRVFLDVKLHDIPTTVNRALKVICNLPIEVVNVHASGGTDMLRAAREAVDSAKHQPKLIAVTVLTSLSTADLNEVGISERADEAVLRFSRLTKACGLDGVVASALDVRAIRETCGQDFMTIVPGTRPAFAQKNDQKRSLTPGEAIQNGSSALVLGRAVTRAEHPAHALRAIWEEMQEAMKQSEDSV